MEERQWPINLSPDHEIGQGKLQPPLLEHQQAVQEGNIYYYVIFSHVCYAVFIKSVKVFEVNLCVFVNFRYD